MAAHDGLKVDAVGVGTLQCVQRWLDGGSGNQADQAEADGDAEHSADRMRDAKMTAFFGPFSSSPDVSKRFRAETSATPNDKKLWQKRGRSNYLARSHVHAPSPAATAAAGRGASTLPKP